MSKVRMSDIADRLGISIVSVSKGLAGKDGVSEELRRRILEAADEMGYKAQDNERPVQIKNIGTVVPDRFFHENVLYYEMYRHLLSGCQHEGISLMLEIVSLDDENRLKLPVLIENQKPDGIILLGEFSEEYCRMMVELDIPVVFLDFYKTNVPCDHVVSDGLAGGYAITEHLIATGRRKIAYVGTLGATSSIMDRYLGFTKAMLRAGIFPREDYLLDDRGMDGELIPVQMPEDMPEAFVCNCDTVAFALIDRLNSLGYRVPEDVAVVGYDDFKFAAMHKPPLTTYHVDIEEMAQATMTLLQRKIFNKRNLSPSMVIPGKLVVRASSER